MDQSQRVQIMENSAKYALAFFGSDEFRRQQEAVGLYLKDNPMIGFRLFWLEHFASRAMLAWTEQQNRPDIHEALVHYIKAIQEKRQDAHEQLMNEFLDISNKNDDAETNILFAGSLAINLASVREDERGLGEAMISERIGFLLNKGFSELNAACFHLNCAFYVFLFIAMWACNYDGLYEVLEPRLPSKPRLTDEEKHVLLPPKKSHKTSRDMDLWVRCALNLSEMAGLKPKENKPIALIFAILDGWRKLAAEVVEKREPVFIPVADSIRQETARRDISLEESNASFNKNLMEMLELKKQYPVLMDDVYFRALIIAHAAWLYQGDDATWREHVEWILNADEELIGGGHIAMFVVCLWCSDYDHFQQRLENTINAL